MTNFDHILNWTLKAGSHDFPGADGGTCINEAAIVAAGFKYKKVNSAYDCPPCFSRPIATYALQLNDRMSDDNIRSELLMPFVTRLSGTADTRAVEDKRSKFILLQIARRLIAGSICYQPKLARSFAAFSTAETLADIRLAAFTVVTPIPVVAGSVHDLAIVHKNTDPFFVCHDALFNSLDLAVGLASLQNPVPNSFWRAAVRILDEAILLGNHPDSIDQDLVVARMNKIREIA